MNPLTYETKRAHWKATWFAIDLFKHCARKWNEDVLERMTPARFDVLYTIWAYRGHMRSALEEQGIETSRRIPMSELRATLGLAASTISRICHRLDELELVRVRRDDPTDGRNASVTLTEEGIYALELAIDCITLEWDGKMHGVRQHIEGYVATRAADGLSKEGTAEEVHNRVLDRLCTIIDRARSYARYLGSKAVAIFDTRVVDQVPYPMTYDEDH